MSAEELADRLERLEAGGEPTTKLVETLRVVRDAEQLWRVADSVVAYPSIMGAIYQRASELRASEDTALGYLALSHTLGGDLEAASKILGQLPRSSRDPVVMSAWAALADDDVERIERLEEGVKRRPDSVRLWRQLATETLRAGQLDRAREAHLWLLTHERDPQQRERVAEIVKQHRWA